MAGGWKYIEYCSRLQSKPGGIEKIGLVISHPFWHSHHGKGAMPHPDDAKAWEGMNNFIAKKGGRYTATTDDGRKNAYSTMWALRGKRDTPKIYSRSGFESALLDAAKGRSGAFVAAISKDMETLKVSAHALEIIGMALELCNAGKGSQIMATNSLKSGISIEMSIPSGYRLFVADEELLGLAAGMMGMRAKCAWTGDAIQIGISMPAKLGRGSASLENGMTGGA